MNLEDQELLTAFVKRGSQQAFRGLVERYTGLVYSAALRRLHDHHRAQDAVQSTFIILAKKARTLSRKVMLGGWLWQTVSLVCGHMIRAETRRRHREQAVSGSTESQTALKQAADAAWDSIRPVLDEALGRVSAKSRDALVARYFMDKTPREIAAELRVSENVVSARINYGLKKLRASLAGMGVKVPGTLLLAILGAKTVEAVPAGLVAATHVTALSAAVGAPTAGGVAVISEQVMRLMLWAKLKVAAAYALVVAAAVGVAVPMARALTAARPAREAVADPPSVETSAALPHSGNWHPGYYLSANSRWDRRTMIGMVRLEPALSGVAKEYAWRKLEPAMGRYDFAELEEDLAALGAVGKRLIVAIGVEGPKARPNAPDWLRGARYGGGVYRTRNDTYRVVQWNAAVSDRLCSLYTALGARLDGAPYLEALMTPEFSLRSGVMEINAQDGVQEMDRAAQIRLLGLRMAALAGAFPNTVVMQQVDWVSMPGWRPWRDIERFARELGVGVACPFMAMRDASLTAGAYTLFPRLAGKVPLGVTVGPHWAELSNREGGPASAWDVLKFAREELRVNYMFWSSRQPHFRDRVQPLLRGAGNVLEKRRPASLAPHGTSI